jgi:hypothetical protein
MFAENGSRIDIGVKAIACMFPRLLPLLPTLGNNLIGKSIDIVIAFGVRKTHIIFRLSEPFPCPAACPR